MSKDKNVPNLVEEGIITQDIRDKADAIKEALHFDASTGVISADNNLFKKHLPEGVLTDDIKKSLAAIGDFTIASKVAVGEYAIDQLAKHPDLKETTAVLSIIPGGNDVHHTTVRYKSGPVPGKDNEKWEKYAQTTTHLGLRLAEGTKTNNSSINDYFSKVASKKLKK